MIHRVRYICAWVVGMLCVWLGPIADSWSAQPYSPVEEAPEEALWRWQRFPELGGLGLRCMAEGMDGAMWFGTDRGVVRYDGTRWVSYTTRDGLPNAPVNALCATGDSSIYAGTDLGIARFKSEKWERVFPTMEGMPWPVDGLSEASDGSLWAATAWGALHVTQDRIVLYTARTMAEVLGKIAPEVAVEVVPDEVVDDHPWSASLTVPDDAPADVGIGVLLAEGGWLGIPRGKTLVMVRTVAEGGPAEAAGLKVGDRVVSIRGYTSVTQERLNGLEGTPVVLEMERDGRRFEVSVDRSRTEGSVQNFSMYDVFEDREGRVWMGLWDGRMVCLDGRTWKRYTEADGMDPGYGPRIMQAKDGTLWVVSNGPGGVNQFDGKTWNHFRLTDVGGSNANTSVLQTRDGSIWVGGFALHVYREGQWKVHFSNNLPMPSHRMRLLEARDGALWVAGLGQSVARLESGVSRWLIYKGLHFQCEASQGVLWFLASGNRVVRFENGRWTQFDMQDGLMDRPEMALVSAKGEVWVAGSHQGIAATARFQGNRWVLDTHLEVTRSLNRAYAASDGSLWFGGGGSPDFSRGQRGGLLHIAENQRTHYTPADGAPVAPYAIGEGKDGRIWSGQDGLQWFDGETWQRILDPEGLTSWVHAIYGEESGDLWVGTRMYGIFRYDGEIWIQYDVKNGLADNFVQSISEGKDGSIWVSTNRGVSRFDGQSWTTQAMPPSLLGRLNTASDGDLWINLPGVRALRYKPESAPPETRITVQLDEVSQPGNTAISWVGVDPWRATSDDELQYSYRLDEEDWSPFFYHRNHIFLALSSGSHRFEVRARDRDFNVDPTPAAIFFKVLPPFWKTPWFIVLNVIFTGIVVTQTVKIITANVRLKEANSHLSAQAEDLEQEVEERQRTGEALRHHQLELAGLVMQQSVALQIGQAVQDMRRPNDLEKVVRVCFDQLKGLGLNFESLMIHRLVDEGSVTFETYEVQPSGAISRILKVRLNVYRMWMSGKTVYRKNLDEDMGGLTIDGLEQVRARLGV
ncbi:MAG: PDZ domain-containing protein, partial [bacterium]|nr:PDZ domain-containing protein [bacterium]